MKRLGQKFDFEVKKIEKYSNTVYGDRFLDCCVVNQSIEIEITLQELHFIPKLLAHFIFSSKGQSGRNLSNLNQTFQHCIEPIQILVQTI